MKAIFNEKELEIINADNSASFNDEKVTMRLSISLLDTSLSVDDIISLNLDTSLIVIKDENQEFSFKDYKIDSIRKSFGNNRLTIELIKNR